MRLRDEISRDLQEMERDVRGPDDEPQKLVYGALTLPCVPTSIENGISIDAEGNDAEIKHSLIVRTEHCQAPGLTAVWDPDAPLPENATPIPNVGAIVRFRWANYRVVARKFDSTQ